MSDEKGKEDVFDLDWDDALSEWERDVESSAEAKARPMPQVPVRPPTSPARALYQPPDPAEIARLRRAKHPPIGQDDSEEMTVLRQLPTLTRPTAPPPAAREGDPQGAGRDRQTHRPTSPDVDLDDVLAGLDDEVRSLDTSTPSGARTGDERVRVPPKVAPTPVAHPPGLRPRPPLLQPRPLTSKLGPTLGVPRPPAPSAPLTSSPLDVGSAKTGDSRGKVAKDAMPDADADALDVELDIALGLAPTDSEALSGSRSSSGSDASEASLARPAANPTGLEASQSGAAAASLAPLASEDAADGLDEFAVADVGGPSDKASGSDVSRTRSKIPVESRDSLDEALDALFESEPVAGGVVPPNAAASTDSARDDGGEASVAAGVLSVEDAAEGSEVEASSKPRQAEPASANSSAAPEGRGRDSLSPSSSAPVPDRGAQAARRTVRARKPRREVFPLVGRQRPALAARAEMLEIVAADESTSSGSRARALLAAGELRLWLGEVDAAAALAERAVSLDPGSVAALRFARAVAVARHDVGKVADLLEREAEASGGEEPRERSVLLAAAADAWARSAEPSRADAAARRAFAMDASLVTALAVLGHSTVDVAEARDILRRSGAAALVPGIAAHAAVRTAAAQGTAPDAEAKRSPAVILAVLGSPALAPQQRRAWWSACEDALPSPWAEAARAVRRLSSGTSEGGDVSRSEQVEATRAASLLLALEDAVRAGDAEAELDATERLADRSSGALASALAGRAALLALRSGQFARAEALVRRPFDATGVIRAARSRLSDMDPQRRQERLATEGAAALAARSAHRGGSEEVDWLERAVEADGATSVISTMLVDASIALGSERARIALRRAAEANPESALGLFVASALAGDEAAAEAFDARTGSALGARLRVLAGRSIDAVARAWGDESTRSEGHAAEIARRERMRARADESPAEAVGELEVLSERDPAAAVLLAHAAERSGTPRDLALAHARLAGLATDRSQRTLGHLRAATIAAEAGDPVLARAQLERAADSVEQDDAVLDLLRWRAADASGAPVPDDLVARRVRSVRGRAASVLETHACLVGYGEPSELDPEQASGVSAEVRAEARRRVERGSASRHLVDPPPSLEAAGTDLRLLRSLERVRAASFEELDRVATTIAEQSEFPEDRAAYFRLAYTVSLRAPADAALEARLVALAEAGLEPDRWVCRRAGDLALRLGRGSLAKTLGLRLAERLTEPYERAAVAMHALERAQRSGVPTSREDFELLRAYAVGAPNHPLLPEFVAHLARTVGETDEAVRGLERAARLAVSPVRRARLFVEAATLSEELGGAEERALGLLEEASRADVTYPGLFERLRAALERTGQKERLAALVVRRLAAGGDDAEAVDLLVAQAGLLEDGGDTEGARRALRAALERSPEHVVALRKLAQLSLADEDYRGAAEALVRLAKLRRDVEELRWVFFELAGIYDRHIPDPKRAEAAYRRVLKLVPDDAAAMDRLAELYRREGLLPQAVEMLEALLKLELDPDRARALRLRLAAIHEQAGDARRAEQTLEATRRASPTDLETLRALADFYTRQRAQPALVMHLNRAAQDFRQALDADLADEAAWIGLVEVLKWRARHDAAAVVASAAVALGIVDVEVAKLVDERGSAPGLPELLTSPEALELAAPSALSPTARGVFERLGPYVEKAFPFDPRSQRAEKLASKDPVAQRVVAEAGRRLGLSEVELWVAPSAPRLCVPLGSQPAALLVGREILAGPEEERQFLLLRSLVIAHHKLAGALRAPPTELSAMLAYVAQQFDPGHRPVGLDAAVVQEQGKRLARHVPRKILAELGPMVLDMVGAPEYEPAALPMAISEFGDRMALLATGSMPAATSALLRLAGIPVEAADVPGRVAAVRRSSEALALVRFAVSEAHFEARRRAGATG